MLVKTIYSCKLSSRLEFRILVLRRPFSSFHFHLFNKLQSLALLRSVRCLTFNQASMEEASSAQWLFLDLFNSVVTICYEKAFSGFFPLGKCK